VAERDLIVTENITLDGVIEAAGDWFGPAGGDSESDQSDVEAALREQMEASDAFLVGRKTFEQMRAYWPKQTDDTTGISNHLNRVQKYVVSRTLVDPEWENTTVLSGELQSEVRALKSSSGKDIVTTGSITVVHGLIDADLVDEFRMFLYPVVVGQGGRLFTDAKLPKLRLVETRQFRSGIVLLRYRRN
jgi:dihydrofolate reductase